MTVIFVYSHLHPNASILVPDAATLADDYDCSDVMHIRVSAGADGVDVAPGCQTMLHLQFDCGFLGGPQSGYVRL